MLGDEFCLAGKKVCGFTEILLWVYVESGIPAQNLPAAESVPF
jgi:hypothetical protein